MSSSMSLSQQFQSLVDIISALRHPETGCPWDLEQTHQSLTRFAIEETAEYVEAVDKGNSHEMCDELGDILLQVILNSEIAKQQNQFTIEDVIKSISEKMIRRHPHVFAQKKVSSSEEVKAQWQDIKNNEKLDLKNQNPSSIHFTKFPEIPVALSSLLASQKIGEKSKQFKFDWSHPNDVLNKVDEEMNELKQALKEENIDHQLEEMGDLLFSLAQLSRHLGFDADRALRLANLKFVDRFNLMSESLSLSGEDIKTATSETLEKHWALAKATAKVRIENLEGKENSK